MSVFNITTAEDWASISIDGVTLGQEMSAGLDRIDQVLAEFRAGLFTFATPGTSTGRVVTLNSGGQLALAGNGLDDPASATLIAVDFAEGNEVFFFIGVVDAEGSDSYTTVSLTRDGRAVTLAGNIVYDPDSGALSGTVESVTLVTADDYSIQLTGAATVGGTSATPELNGTIESVVVYSPDNEILLSGADGVLTGFFADGTTVTTLGDLVSLLSRLTGRIVGGGEEAPNPGESIRGGSGNDSLVGGAADDFLTGRGGHDTLFGAEGDDSQSGGDGNDDLFDQEGDDTLVGGAGNDWLGGGVGNDSMAGGPGDDNYEVDSLQDTVSEAANGGYDQVTTTLTEYTLPANVESLVFANLNTNTGVGNALSNGIGGHNGDDNLDGAGGNDDIRGAGGDDTLLGGAGNDTLGGDAGNDVINGGLGVDAALYWGELDQYSITDLGGGLVRVLHSGSDGDDTLSGVEFLVFADQDQVPLVELEGDNFSGGAGNDSHNGGSGDDIFAGNGGNDSFYGAAGDDSQSGGAGNDLLYDQQGNDTLLGGDGNDWLAPGADDDSMVGGAGDDRYDVDSLQDIVVEEAGGGDFDIIYVYASVTSYTLPEHVEALSWGFAGPHVDIGSATGNYLYGGVQGDTLFGGGGNDTLSAHLGPDHFVFDNPPGPGNVDWIMNFETGQDAIVLDQDIFTALPLGVWTDANPGTLEAGEYLRYDAVTHSLYYDPDGPGGAAEIMFVGLNNGPAFNVSDVIVLSHADAHAIILPETPPNQSMNGSAGADTLVGGNGNDSFFGAGGDDSQSGEAGNDQLWDQLGNDTILGGAGNDWLAGGSGNDSMAGGVGDDRYEVDSLQDTVLEGADAGYDQVTTTLTAYTMPDSIENLVFANPNTNTGTGNGLNNDMFGHDGNESLDGAGGNDVIYGAGGNDTLRGDAGDDCVHGGAGNDILIGGAGADQFVFEQALGSTNVDTISDFVSGQDGILLRNHIFTALAEGPVVDADLGTLAAGEHLRYNAGTGSLYYDPDGPGGMAEIKFAALAGNPALAGSDLLITT